MTKNRLFLAIMVMVATFFAISASTKEIVVHSSGGNQAHDQLYIEHPQVTFDEELCELSVYFGSTSTIDLECVDATGTPYYYVYGEYHVACETTTYSNLPSGYYTITIHSVYGVDYTGNFTVN